MLWFFWRVFLLFRKSENFWHYTSKNLTPPGWLYYGKSTTKKQLLNSASKK